MIEMRKRKLTFAIVALVLILAGCKSESPTAPPVTPGGTTPGGGITPPTNPTVRITASNTSPLVNSNVIITATVTENSQNVPNGTAVQFTTTLGTFTDTGATTSVRITTNGVSTATLTSAGAGTAHVTATVANVSASVDVTFSTVPVTPQPPSTTPTITTIVPTTGPPAGGTQVTINGTNFRTPVRVLFDIGDGNPREAFVASVSCDTNRRHHSSDQSDDRSDQGRRRHRHHAGRFSRRTTRCENAGLHVPAVGSHARDPNRAADLRPIGGGTRVTIIGDAFQQPVQVFFGSAEAQIISVNFDHIIVMSPRASDTAPGGSGVVTGPVPVTVRNIGSNTTGTSPQQFRYTPKMQITTVGPTEGPFTGGTRIRIDGVGFDDPLAVSVAGIAAQVISVSGSEVIVQTVGVNLSSCGDVSGPIVVTNTENGDTADGPNFTFRVPRPLITNISNPNNAGTTATITVLNALGFARITIGGVAVPITPRFQTPMARQRSLCSSR